MEIRHYLRVPIQCPIEISGDEFYAEGSVIDCSLGGWTIECAQPVTPGVPLRLRVLLPDDEDKPLEVKHATVHWAQDGQCGLKTELMEEKEQKRLQKFIVANVNKSSRRK